MTNSDGPSVAKGQPGLVRAALFALCPRCGAPGLFEGAGQFAETCRGCGLDFAAHEASGRTLYPLVLPLVIALVLGALRFDDAFHPPLWVHLLIWPPVVSVTMIGAVRLGKVLGLMRHLAREEL